MDYLSPQVHFVREGVQGLHPVEEEEMKQLWKTATCPYCGIKVKVSWTLEELADERWWRLKCGVCDKTFYITTSTLAFAIDGGDDSGTT